MANKTIELIKARQETLSAKEKEERLQKEQWLEEQQNCLAPLLEMVEEAGELPLAKSWQTKSYRKTLKDMVSIPYDKTHLMFYDWHGDNGTVFRAVKGAVSGQAVLTLTTGNRFCRKDPRVVDFDEAKEVIIDLMAKMTKPS